MKPHTFDATSAKSAVREFWQEASCGEKLYLGANDDSKYDEQARKRYLLEPYILSFAEFEKYAGKRVLEVGVGLGADHENFARSGAILSGVDLTSRAIDHTRIRLKNKQLISNLQVADAENLPFPDDFFDLVYSWGVIHCSPDTQRAANEIIRVLKPGGELKVMIYYKYSMVGFMLWLRYALARLRPWISLEKIYAQYLESPGTKAYSIDEARILFKGVDDIRIKTILTHGDLLTSDVGQRHRGPLLILMRKIWPRHSIRALLPGNGLFMTIHGRKR